MQTEISPQEIEDQILRALERAQIQLSVRTTQFGPTSTMTQRTRENIKDLEDRLASRRHLNNLFKQNPRKDGYPHTVKVQSSDPKKPPYFVTVESLDGPASFCNCLGFEYRGHCRHLEEGLIMAWIKHEDGIPGW
jgi:alpha-acetolactate decarboxylase